MVSNLSPKEKEKLERFMKNVQKLVPHLRRLPSMFDFVVRQQTKEALKLLGNPQPNRKLVTEALLIMGNPYPFKKYQLRKLIRNGRR
jgi:hypothetical protein